MQSESGDDASTRWIIESSESNSERLTRALAAAGFKVHQSWEYPPYPRPFTVQFWDEQTQVTVEFENSEGLLVIGPAAVVRRLQAEFEQLSSTGH